MALPSAQSLMSNTEVSNKSKNKNTICKTKFKGKIENLRSELLLKDAEIAQLRRITDEHSTQMSKYKELALTNQDLITQCNQLKKTNHELITQYEDLQLTHRNVISKCERLEESNHSLEEANQELKYKYSQLQLTSHQLSSKVGQLELSNQQLLVNYNLVANLYNGLLVKQEMLNKTQSQSVSSHIAHIKVVSPVVALSDLDGPDLNSYLIDSGSRISSISEPFDVSIENLTNQLIYQLQDNYKQGRIHYQSKDNHQTEDELNSNTLQWLNRLDQFLDMHCHFRPDLRILRKDLAIYALSRLSGLSEDQFYYLMRYRVDAIRINYYHEGGRDYYIGLALLDDYRLIDPELTSRIYRGSGNQTMIESIRDFISGEILSLV